MGTRGVGTMWGWGAVLGMLMFGSGGAAPVHGAEEPSVTAPLREEAGVEETSHWKAPQEQEDETRLVRYLVHVAYTEDQGQTARAETMLDLSVRRKLDDAPWGASALVRFRKGFSSGDDAQAVELREAKALLGLARFQAVFGRFDLQPTLSPLAFFGAYPLMGARRVDGLLATVPVFFRFGDREDASGTSAPLAFSFAYTPSLLSAETARMDKTQGFFLGQVRGRLGGERDHLVLRVSGGKTRNALFEYSSLSGDPCLSASFEYVARRSVALCGEWAIQNLSHSRETAVASGGLRFERIATVGLLSLDAVAFEVQVPMQGSTLDVFTGGDPFDPTRGTTPKSCWYAKVKGRLGSLLWECQATTNRDDYTLARAAAGSLGPLFPSALGVGRQGGDALLPLRSSTGRHPALMARCGVAF